MVIKEFFLIMWIYLWVFNSNVKELLRFIKNMIFKEVVDLYYERDWVRKISLILEW